MDDYIKREDAIMTAMNYDGTGNAQDASQDIAADLTSIPAADVRENVRGEWIKDGKYGQFYVCNNCGEQRIFPHWRYCPDCGADMRGE